MHAARLSATSKIFTDTNAGLSLAEIAPVATLSEYLDFFRQKFTC
jgi:hypothetical protein